MFRGSSVVRVDEKGRIKVPSQFRQYAETQYGNEFYITSFNGKFARLYPLPVWVDVEKWIDAQPEFDPDIMHFQEVLTYWGAMATMDGQGRILLPADLRRQAIPVYFTIDAGPQVKLISLPAYTKVLIEKLTDIPGLEDVIESSLGGDAMIEEREG